MAISATISPEEIKALPLESISYRCNQEYKRFFQRVEHDPRFCFELFRRAIEGRDEVAWRLVYEQYSPLVSGWVVRHNSFVSSGEEARYFVNRAFERFWAAIPPGKFHAFADLKSLLGYLHMCVNGAIVDHQRKKELETVLLSEAIGNPGARLPYQVEDLAMDRIQRVELLEEVSKRLKDEREQTVFYGSFVLGLKAREIQETNKQEFGDVREIYVIRQNILARLKRDRELRLMFFD